MRTTPNEYEEELGQMIWNYSILGHELKKANIIFVLGSIDLLPAEHAADLFKKGLAPYVLFSGKGGRNFELCPMKRNGITEAELLAEFAMGKGLPYEKILLEKKSTNTGENVRFSKKLLEDKGINSRLIISSHMPSSERRDYATLRKQWEGPEFIMSSPNVPFREYNLRGYQGLMTRADLISDMLGDFQRLFIFPKKGFMIEQEEPVPENVKEAYVELVSLGYGEGQLIKDEKGEIVNIFN